MVNKNRKYLKRHYCKGDQFLNASNIVHVSIMLIFFFCIISLFFLFNQEKTKAAVFTKRKPTRTTPQLWKHVDTVTHDYTCFTQGLEFLNDTHLLESCGLYQQSSLRLYELPKRTSVSDFDQTLHLKYLKKVNPAYFAEGLTVGVNQHIYMLTWKENKLLVYDSKDLTLLYELDYPLHGWGLAYDPKNELFYSTDGTQYLYQFQILPTHKIHIQKKTPVFCQGIALSNLNELEYDLKTNQLYVNVWYNTNIYTIEPSTGNCTAVYNLSSIVENPVNVLNGIAKRKNSDNLWITGKNWRFLHEIQLLS